MYESNQTAIIFQRRNHREQWRIQRIGDARAEFYKTEHLKLSMRQSRAQLDCSWGMLLRNKLVFLCL